MGMHTYHNSLRQYDSKYYLNIPHKDRIRYALISGYRRLMVKTYYRYAAYKMEVFSFYHRTNYVRYHSEARIQSDTEKAAQQKIEQPYRELLGISRFSLWPNGGNYTNIYWTVPDIISAKLNSDSEPMCADCVNSDPTANIVVSVDSGSNYEGDLRCCQCDCQLADYYDNDNDNDNDN